MSERASKAQAEWQKISALVRERFAKEAARLAERPPEELADFVDAAREAILLEHEAATFDQDVGLRESRVTYSDS